MDETLTKIGQAIISLVLSISSTKFGQIFDKSLSNIRKILGKENTFRQILDKNENFGQIMDNYLTKLSKISIILTNMGH